MRKGLQFTLLTVAFALISVQAMAMAPTILDIPSPIVGNAEAVTGGGRFIYIDAMNLDNLATDDSTLPKDLMWTYTTTNKARGGSLTDYYLINGVPPLSAAEMASPGDIRTSPTTNRIINRTVIAPEFNSDGKANTITIRNNYLSPLGATGAAAYVDEGWPDGIIGGETTPVTFYCSDGTTYSSKTVMFYSTNNDFDHLSGNLWKPVMSGTSSSLPITQPKPVDTKGTGWKPEAWSPGVTSSTWANGSTGLCLNTALLGSNIGEYVSPLPYFQLAKNTIYRIRLQMNGTQGTVGQVPLWDFVVENIVPSTGVGLMAYMMDTYFYDDPFNGGANTVVNTQAGTEKVIYWAPFAVDTEQWNTKAFDVKYDNVNDPRLRFRVMDVDAVGMGNTKSGGVCITSIAVDSIPIGRVRVLSNVYDIEPGQIKQATSTAGVGNVEVVSLISAFHITVTFANGAVTIKPTTTSVPNSYNNGVQTIASTGQQFEFTEVHPATDTNAATESDNWPITWEANTIYRLQVSLSAPTTSDAAKPWDAVFLGLHTKTYELFSEGYMTSRDLLGSPTVTPSTYTLFFQSGKGTLASAANAKIRWWIRFANSPVVAFPSTNPTIDPLNTGAVTVNSVKVDKVDFIF
jgi:hypothetical protein